ncbi:MAG: cyclic nucleotide-binding domain-containing protein [Verrucomicrobiales bacterium]
MSNSDFFSFCTSLKPLELRALGELSKVQHLDEGVTIYSSGDPSDALYIINRGAVAVIHEDPRYSDRADVSYLSRGDMFGELDLLTDSPRRNAIRTCEQVSLQCFRKEDFPELIRRIPGFFYYIAQRLSQRFVQVTDVAFVQSHCLELSGSLQNFDLITIYQTIVNSSQTGELAVFNENNEAIAVFYFQEGKLRSGQYYNLSGEEAFFQLLLHENMAGTFSFSITEEPPQDESQATGINRDGTDILITSLQYRDEFKELVEQLPDSSALLQRQKLNLDWPDEPDLYEFAPVAEMLWQSCYTTPISIDDLFQQLGLCEFKLYKTASVLLETGHFALVPSEHSYGVA